MDWCAFSDSFCHSSNFRLFSLFNNSSLFIIQFTNSSPATAYTINLPVFDTTNIKLNYIFRYAVASLSGTIVTINTGSQSQNFFLKTGFLTSSFALVSDGNLNVVYKDSPDQILFQMF